MCLYIVTVFNVEHDYLFLFFFIFTTNNNNSTKYRNKIKPTDY